MTAVRPEAPGQAVVEAALVLLDRIGLTPADLAAVPSLASQYRPSPSTSRSYRQR